MEEKDLVTQVFEKIFSDLDSLDTKDAKLVIDDTKSKFEAMAKIKLSEIKRREDRNKIAGKIQPQQEGINDLVANTQVPAEDMGQPTPSIIG